MKKKMEYAKTLFDKNIAVGVEHLKEPGRLFFFYGVLTELDSENRTIILRTKNGIREVKLKDIRDIHEVG